jgi:hypothetical protein
VDIGMTDAAKENLDLDVKRPRVAALEGIRNKWRGGGMGGVRFCGIHGNS